MAMGKRKRGRQQELWIETRSLPQSPGHPFYERLNRVLSSHGFDDHVEGLCSRFYSEDKRGRPSLAPGVYFRMLLIGYFEGLDSERGIAWRCADSLALRSFLGYSLEERPADHSTVSRTRRLIDVETHGSVFSWVLGVLVEEGLVSGKTIGIDATTLEANAALRSIVRRETGETYDEFLTSLAESSGIETPTRNDLAKVDRKRSKKGSNDDWQNPHDPDAQITRMKDGRTHLAHKAEHAVDLDSGAVLSVTLQGGAKGDTTSVWQTLAEAERNLATLGESSLSGNDGVLEVVMDKGYHSNAVLLELTAESYRTYVSEPDRGRRNWSGKRDEQDAVYGNRRRIRGNRGKRLLRSRGELLERPFSHYLDSGGMRRTHLRRHDNILKRLLIQVAGCNLGLVMRKLVGRGTPRGLHAACGNLIAPILSCYRAIAAHVGLLTRWMDHFACPQV